jgi:hypothetical protein
MCNAGHQSEPLRDVAQNDHDTEVADSEDGGMHRKGSASATEGSDLRRTASDGRQTARTRGFTAAVAEQTRRRMQDSSNEGSMFHRMRVQFLHQPVNC